MLNCRNNTSCAWPFPPTVYRHKQKNLFSVTQYKRSSWRLKCKQCFKPLRHPLKIDYLQCGRQVDVVWSKTQVMTRLNKIHKEVNVQFTKDRTHRLVSGFVFKSYYMSLHDMKSLSIALAASNYRLLRKTFAQTQFPLVSVPDTDATTTTTQSTSHHAPVIRSRSPDFWLVQWNPITHTETNIHTLW